MSWTNDRIEQAERIFRAHVSYQDALDEVCRVVKECTTDSLAGAFRRSGKPSPRQCLRVPLREDTKLPPPPAMPSQTELCPPPSSATVPSGPVSSRLQKVVLIGDIHGIYRNRPVWDLFVRSWRGFAPDVICSVGDLIDFYSVSRYDKSPGRCNKAVEEIDDANEILDDIESTGARRKILTLGNHDARWEAWLYKNAPAMHGMPGTSLAELLRLKERGWEWCEYGEKLKIGSLNVTHNGGSCGKTAIRTTNEYWRADVASGHHHRLGVTYSGDVDGRLHYAIGLGWTGEHKMADYRMQVEALREYHLGFTTGYLDTQTQRVHVSPVPYMDRSVVVGGVLYEH